MRKPEPDCRAHACRTIRHRPYGTMGPGITNRNKTMTRTLPILLCGLAVACTFDLRPGADSGGVEAAAPERKVMVSAQLFYPERIALPPDAVVQVRIDRVTGDGRSTLVEYRNALRGRQVPVPLGLSFDHAKDPGSLHELRAWIDHRQLPLRDTGPVLLEPESEVLDLGRLRLFSRPASTFGRAWECGVRQLQFAAFGERAWLTVDQQQIALERAPSASGVRYQAGEDAQTWVHEKSGEHRFAVDGDTLDDCRPWPGVSRPVVARGHEPGWRLELLEDSVELSYDYGEHSLALPLIEARTEGLSEHFRAAGEGQALLASFSQSICRDSATGMPHPWTVSVQVAGRRLEGCGGEPIELLTGRDWRIEQVGDGRPGELDIEMTLRFDAGGRLSGQAACNRYFADYTLTPERLSIAQPGATLMACPGDTLGLDKRLFELLAATRRFDIDQRGRLILVSEQGRIEASEDDGR